MGRQPKEEWCPYCRKEVAQWQPRRKSKSRHPTASNQKIRSNVRRWYECPHCGEKHPWWQYEWAQAVFFAAGFGIAGTFSGFERDRLVYTIGIGVVISIALTQVLRFGYVWYVYRDRPANDLD